MADEKYTSMMALQESLRPWVDYALEHGYTTVEPTLAPGSAARQAIGVMARDLKYKDEDITRLNQQLRSLRQTWVNDCSRLRAAEVKLERARDEIIATMASHATSNSASDELRAVLAIIDGKVEE